MGVQNTVAAVGGFARKGEVAAMPVKFSAPVNQFADGSRAFFHQRMNGSAIAEPIARVERILLVKFNFIVIVQGDGNAALRIFRGGFA